MERKGDRYGKGRQLGTVRMEKRAKLPVVRREEGISMQRWNDKGTDRWIRYYKRN